MKTRLRSKITALCMVAVMLVTILPSNIAANVFGAELPQVEFSDQTEPSDQTDFEAVETDQTDLMEPVEEVDPAEEAVPQTYLKCKFQVHAHEEDCYDQSGKLICGYADYVVHTHDEKCYDSNGTLVCELPEVKEHVHDDSCYTAEDAVFSSVEETTEGHVHSEECYQTQRTLICGREEESAHTHTAECYEQHLICQIPETAGHIHDASCYVIEKVLDCGQAEVMPHTHTETCYDSDGNLICQTPETEGHIHDASCYLEESVLNCGQEEVTPHTHTAECYENVLVCGLSETAGHVHDDSCYKEESVLVCGLEETADGFSDTESGTSSKDNILKARTIICGKPEVRLHTHTDTCYNQDGQLICGQLEVLSHQHTEECFSAVSKSRKLVQASNSTVTKTDYVGFINNRISCSGGLNTWPIYVSTYSDFASSSATAASRVQNAEIAYCFNYNRKQPLNYVNGNYIATCIRPLSAAVRAAFSGQTGPY